MKPCGGRPQTSDDIFCRGPGGWHRLITWAQRRRGEPPTLASHCAKFLDHQSVVSADARGVSVHPWPAWRKAMDVNGVEYLVLTPLPPLSENIRKVAHAELCTVIGRPYAMLELPCYLFDGLLSKATGREVVFFRRLGALIPWTMVCSTTNAYVDIQTRQLPPDMRFASPDDLLDYKLKQLGQGLYAARCVSDGFFKPAEKGDL